MRTRPVLVGPLIHLGTLPLFRTLSHQQLSAIAFETEEVVYEADSWIFARGEPVRAMSMLLDGFADTVRPDGVRLVAPGTLVGFPDILVQRPATYGVRARGDVVALRLATDELRDLCEHNYGILSALLSHLCDRIAHDREARHRVVQGARPGSAPPLPAGPLDRVGRILAMHRSPAFPSESMDAIAELAGHVHQIDLADGEVLWAAAERADRFAVVCRGSIELDESGLESVTVGPGAVPGLPEALGAGDFLATARAVGDSAVLAIDVDPFTDVLEDHFEMGFSLLGWLAGHLIEQP